MIKAWMLTWMLGACFTETDEAETARAALGSLPPTVVCAPNTTLVDGGDNPVWTTLATFHQEFQNGGARFLEATLTGTVDPASGSSSPMQGLQLECLGPTRELIQTTQNALRGAGPLTTKAHLTITGPGTWNCNLKGITMHTGARLDVTGNKTCISSWVSDAQDWPHWPADSDAVGPGRRIYKYIPEYLLHHDFSFGSSVASVAFRADIELTDIESNASGVPDSLYECEQQPFTDGAPAYPRVHVEARQRSTTGFCGLSVKGSDLDVTITALAHHQKVSATLDVPVSKAPGCLPTFETKIFIASKGGGNDVCFHASRYSNLYAYPLSYDSSIPPVYGGP